MARDDAGGRPPSEDYWDGGYAEQGTGVRPVPSDLPAGLVEALGDVDGRYVLDIGCGEGDLAIWLARHGASVVAVDRSSSSVEVTGRNAAMSGVGELVDARVLAAADLDRLDSLFDLVVGRFVLETVEPFDLFVGALANLLGADGRGVFYVNRPANPAVPFAPDRIAALKERFDVTQRNEIVEVRRTH